MRSNSVIHSLILPVCPVPKARPRMTRMGHAFTPFKTRVFENTLSLLMRSQYKLPPKSGAIELQIVFELPRPKSQKNKYPSGHIGDLDNFAKAVCDAANGVLWVDDCQIVSMNLSKVYGPGVGQITINFCEKSDQCISTKQKS